jgi:regulator of Ty1 transposition protein 109
MGLVRKKRKGGPEESKELPASFALDTAPPKVNVLSSGMIRKKAKS